MFQWLGTAGQLAGPCRWSTYGSGSPWAGTKKSQALQTRRERPAPWPADRVRGEPGGRPPLRSRPARQDLAAGCGWSAQHPACSSGARA